MENLIKEVFEKKMKDGTIETIINKKIEELVNSSCDSLFKYNGIIRKQMEEKLEEVMSNVLENSDFSSYTIKLTTLINSILPDTALEDYKNISENIKTVCGTKLPPYKEKLGLSEIFDKYVEYIEGEVFNKSDFEDSGEIDGRYGYVECFMEYDYCDNKITFKIEGVENADDYEKVVKIDIIGGDRHISRRNFENNNLFELKYASKFDCYLMVLSNMYVKLELDKEESESTACVEVEYD